MHDCLSGYLYRIGNGANGRGERISGTQCTVNYDRAISGERNGGQWSATTSREDVWRRNT